MAKSKKAGEIKDLSFEESIRQLTDIVNKIEAGETALEDSLAQYERGMALIKHCRGILQKAEKRILNIACEGGGDDEKKDEEEGDKENQGAEEDGGLF